MSVIIRLQNLPWTANARDIRNFFTGLSIPEGGVHIIGGEMGDAFIAFSTDEDARCAMLKDREKLMEIQVRLLLSSRAEMQKVIETARTPAPVVAPAPVPVPVPVPMPVPVAAPQPPIIGGLNSFLSQSQSKAGVPSFLAYQQQAGIVLAEVTGGSQHRRQSRSRSRSRSSSSEDSDRELRDRERERELERERDRERDRAIRKRRLERGDSSERELKLQSSGVSAAAAGGLSPWANPPQTNAALSLPGLGSLPGMSIGMGLGLGLGLGVPPVLPSLQNYTTSNTANNYNMTNANGPAAPASAPAPAPPLAPDAHKLIAALQAAARAGSNSPAQMEGQQQQVQQVQRQAVQVQAQEQPVAFASVNPYAQIYPQLFQQQQQVLLQQQTAAKLSPSMGGSPGGGGGGGSHSPRGGGGGGGMSSAVADTCYVKISGMCQSTSYSDLRKYFQGLYIPHNGIKIMTVNGSRTGVAYIEFSRVSSAQKALQRHNTMFRDRLVQIVPIGDAEFEQADEYSHRNQQHQQQQQQQQLPQDVLARNASSDRGGGGGIPSFNVLYLEDLPQLTTEQDIMKMFSATCTIVDILLAPSPNNRREFVAFVLFARETEALSALEDQSRHYIGFRQLRVRPSSQAEMMQAKEKQRRANEQLLKEEADQREELLKDQKRRQQAQAQLLLQQQQQQQQQQQREEMAMQARFNSDPRRRNADDNPNRDQQQQQQQQLQLLQQQQQQNQMQPFGNTGPMPNGIMPFVVQQQLQQLQQQNNGGGGGPQNFPFNNNNNNNNMDNQNRNQNHNGGGPIMEQSINRNHNGGGPFGGGMSMPHNQNEVVRPPRQEDNFVRVHNCEYATRVNDLGELFSLENLRIEHIEMLINDRNQSTGEFIIEFGDGSDAKQAIREFHNRRFRGRGLRVLAITPQEIADRMNKPFMDYLPGGNGPRQSDNGGTGVPAGAPPPSRRRPSRFDNNNQQQQQQQQQQQVPPERERQRQEDEDSNSSQKQHFNPFARPDPPVNPSGSLSPPLNVSNSSSSSIPDKFNRPGCVVAMRNVPFKAELKDILRFFSDYKLSPDDIIRRFNDDGKPTGDTRVAFESPAEARSAYESRRRKQIFSRTVNLDII
ncbi:mediator of RNA polymerase II transcription subunit 12 [Drosophila obscura]|uniref:mediator of RNA polymerase II transcription subunit 12 n=1 Tax=Drosophila obscura TaxID=7282 RepID=UPI001BB1300E|nr:mediator of RNA polymerase II transcription subunit 12 [Drosophila obscura]XP_022216837.2 mediator of RNA polymerase II transcription subunit 12 [Drosophila obscura]